MLRSCLQILAMLLLALPLIGADADPAGPPAQGLDVGRTAERVRDWLKPPARDKPWSNDIADLSGTEPGPQRRAVASLIRYGEVVLPDLAVLAQDRDPELRMRVVEVAAGIGGRPPVALLLTLSRDRELRVRQIAVLGLGRCSGPKVYERLLEALGAPDAEERGAAAEALGALGDVRALDPLAHLDQEQDDITQHAMSDALGHIAAQAGAVPDLSRLIGGTSGKAQEALILASATLGDPRLCPALVAITHSDAPPYTRWLAVHALASDGDSRAWQSLCAIAAEASEPELREVAAVAMHALTGHGGQGQAWTVWWHDHAADVPHVIARDTMLAQLHDPTAAITRAELDRFSVEDLAPLLDGALGSGAAWWPARAFAIICADEPRRWSAEMTRRVLSINEPLMRLALTILIDQLGGPTAVSNLHLIQADLDARMHREVADARAGHLVPERGAELLALRVALERRNLHP